MAIDITHDLEVAASAAVVWEVLTDMKKYEEWNPFLLACDSTLKPGDPMNLTVQLGKSVRNEQEVMATYDEGKGFSYQMKPPPLGALASRRSHEIQAISDSRCRYISRFHLEGWLSPVVNLAVGKHLHTGFDGMSHGIKKRAEQLAAERRN